MTRYEYFEFPPDDIHRSVLAWLRLHGIDAMRVLIPGWIEPRPGPRQVAYLSYVEDDDGQPALAAAGHIAERVEVLQLESPPMPLPEEFIRWAWQDVGAHRWAVTPP
ncbi:hypothetical protein [Pseudonocardia sp. WMMC193]|uniref:hypothetical protein n=1 Tax=Pseudonocardia sp. WMMC193 TaxID=2911965 RepID=UPI001F24162B|nr:hypothetical protein [Pseudonocardia sp. WMMC193]MCF7550989.1 hypothetical protein [Pseudonocardia sp. WMMC193]